MIVPDWLSTIAVWLTRDFEHWMSCKWELVVDCTTIGGLRLTLYPLLSLESSAGLLVNRIMESVHVSGDS
jgi:hypothetical protein